MEDQLFSVFSTLQLDDPEMRRVHQKVERLLNTGKLMNTKTFYFKIPAHSTYTVQQVKKCVLKFSQVIRVGVPMYIIKLWRYKMKVSKTKGCRVKDLVPSCISTTQKFDLQNIRS